MAADGPFTPGGPVTELQTEELTAELKSLESRKLQLETKKLEYELRDLSLLWWQRPTWAASVVSMIGAVVGLIWVMSTGFFDTRFRELDARRRELQVETRQLQEERNRQNANLVAERQRYEALEQRSQELERQLSQLDVPRIAEGSVVHGPWDKGSRSSNVEINLHGFNFSRRPGAIDVAIVAYGPDTNGAPVHSRNVPLRIRSWSDTRIYTDASELTRDFVRATIRTAAAKYGVAPARCVVRVRVTVHRSDKKTDYQELSLPEEAEAWLRSG